MIDYQAAADDLGVDERTVRAVAAVESSGAWLWTIDGEQRPVIRLEAHWFGKLTGYAFNGSHPQISCRQWNPSLAGRTPAEAWRQFEEAEALNADAAIQATSWGAFQIMGFHWQALGYDSPAAMRADMATEQGQVAAFARFVKADPVMHDALRRRDWHAFAARYNGPGQVDVYARRMGDAFEAAA